MNLLSKMKENLRECKYSVMSLPSQAYSSFDEKYRYIGEFTESEAKIICRFIHNVF